MATNENNVLIYWNNPNARNAVAGLLMGHGHQVRQAASLRELKELLSTCSKDALVVTAHRLTLSLTGTRILNINHGNSKTVCELVLQQ